MKRTMQPIRHTTRVTVRFKEADVLGIVWHGNYVAYLEDARQALGERLGLSYQDILDEGYLAPVVDLKIQYKAPARYGDKLDVTAVMQPTEVPKLVMTYEVRRAADGRLLAAAETTQVFTTPEGELALNFPAFLTRIRERWQAGDFEAVGREPAPSPWA